LPFIGYIFIYHNMFNYINPGCIMSLVAAPLKEFTIDDSK